MQQQHITNRLPGLDFLRAFAIVSVYLFHYGATELTGPAGWIQGFGWTGVDLFFVLSGFLIANQLFAPVAAGKSISIKEFYIKRFFRIMPVFWVVLALYFSWPAFREREALSPLWKFLTFTQNIGLHPSLHGTFSHAWSLCVEEQFYLFFPLILLGCVHFRLGKRSFYVILFFFLVCCTIRLYVWFSHVVPAMQEEENYSSVWVTWLYYPTYTRLDGLLTGISIAGLVQFAPHWWQRISRYGYWLQLAGLGILIGCYHLCMDRISFNANIIGFPLIAIGYGLLLMGAISPDNLMGKLSIAPVRLLAVLSYSIYLIHKATNHLVQDYLTEQCGFDIESKWVLLICFLVAVSGALVLYYTVERPFMHLRNRLLHKWQGLRVIKYHICVLLPFHYPAV